MLLIIIFKNDKFSLIFLEAYICFHRLIGKLSVCLLQYNSKSCGLTSMEFSQNVEIILKIRRLNFDNDCIKIFWVMFYTGRQTDEWTDK